MRLFRGMALALAVLIILGTSPGVFSVSENSTQNKCGIKVEVNPNLELFAVLYILAFNGSDYFITAPKGYINDVLTYFAPYRDDPTVKYTREVFNSSLPLYARDIESWNSVAGWPCWVTCRTRPTSVNWNCWRILPGKAISWPSTAPTGVSMRK